MRTIRASIAVVNVPNEALFKKLGIDVTISSTNVILESISEAVPPHPLTHLMTVHDQGLEIVEIKIPTTATTIGQQIKQLDLPKGCTLILDIGKERKPLVPNSETIIEGGEQIIAVTPPEAEEALRTALRGIK